MTKTPTSPASPRLKLLQENLKNGSETALNLFWEEITQTGTPLVEPLPDEPDLSLVTFLWQAQEELENIVICSHLLEYDPQKGLMQPLPNTDLWYLSVKTRNDIRCTYHFSLNDPLTSIIHDENPWARLSAMKTDPLNPLRINSPEDEDNPEGYPVSFSVLEMPHAAPQPWSTPRPEVPAGNLEVYRLSSKLLNNERRVWLYTPPDYDPEAEPYPLLLIFDGFAYTHGISAPAVLDNLLADGLIPPFVSILVNSGTDKMRSLELPCHTPFTEFLVEELLPWAHEKIHFTRDPHRTYVAGSSYGGLASSFAAFQHPEVFGNVLSQSGSYWWLPEDAEEDEWLIRQYALAERKDLRFYMDVGTLETMDIRPGGPNQRLANRHMRDVLQAKGYPLHYTEYSGGHDYVWWQGTLADGLLALLKMQE